MSRSSLLRVLAPACAIVTTLAWPAVRVAGQGYSTGAPAMPGRFATTCSEAAEASVQSGVSLLLVLAYEEAERAFERAESDDADCAIASWGRALSILRLTDPETSAADEQRAVRALARAAASARVSGRERAYIDVAQRAFGSSPSSRASRLHTLAVESAALAARDQSDPDAPLIAALAWLATSTVPRDNSRRQAVRLVASTLDRQPDDARAATLLLIAHDGEEAESTLPAARTVLGASLPSWRALSAAARRFEREGAWEDVLVADRAILELAGGAESKRLLSFGGAGLHPLPRTMRAYAELGRFDAARTEFSAWRERFDARSATATTLEAWRLRALLDLAWLEFQWRAVDLRTGTQWPLAEEWARVATTAVPADAEPVDHALALEVRAFRAFVEGILAARAAWPRGEPERLQAARSAAAVLEQCARERPHPPRFEVMRTLVLAGVAAALEARDELALLSAHVLDREREVVAAGEGDALVDPAARVLGDLRGLLRDWRDARGLFEVAARQRPKRARTVLGLGRACARTGDAACARGSYHALTEQWAAGDATRPELRDARDYLK